MGILKDLYNPTIDGVEYTGLFNAVMQKYNYVPSYLTVIVASLVDGYTYNAHGDALLRPIYEACKTTPDVMKSAYDALYHVLATHESDLQRYNDLAGTNLKGLVTTETIRNEYGQDVTLKSYGADILQKSFGNDVTSTAYGQVVVTVDNAPRQNTTVNSTAPYDTTAFADRDKSVSSTTTFTDTTTSGTHTDTETRNAHSDMETRNARTDTDTRNSHTDNTTRSTILSMSARDFYELEKMLIGCNFYEEIASSILMAVCMSIY